jgi:hypothetical protein
LLIYVFVFFFIQVLEKVDSVNLSFADMIIVNVQIVSWIHETQHDKIIKNNYSTIITKKTRFFVFCSIYILLEFNHHKIYILINNSKNWNLYMNSLVIGIKIYWFCYRFSKIICYYILFFI